MVFYLFTPNTHQFVVSFSLAHQLNEPFFSSIPVEIVFPVTSQIPLTNYFPLAKGKVIKPIHMNEGLSKKMISQAIGAPGFFRG